MARKSDPPAESQDAPRTIAGFITYAEIRRRFGWGTSRLYRLVDQRQVRRLELPGKLLYSEADVASIDSREA